MRLHVVILVVIVASVIGTIDGFFLKKAPSLPESLSNIKVNLVKDGKEAMSDLAQGTHLKVKGVTGGIKAIGKAKLDLFKGVSAAKIGLVKGVKAAKIGLLKKIAGAKLAKVAAIKAGKLAIAKALVAAKAAPLVAAVLDDGKIETIKRFIGAGLPLAVLGGTTSNDAQNDQPSSPLFSFLGNFVGNSATDSTFSIIPEQISNILSRFGQTVALFPAPAATPLSTINIVTYKNEAPVNSIPENNVPLASSNLQQSPALNYGEPGNLPATSYDVPIHQPTSSSSFITPIKY